MTFVFQLFQVSSPQLTSLASKDLMSCNEVMSLYFPFLLQRQWEKRGWRRGDSKKKMMNNFCWRKILPFPWERKDLGAVKLWKECLGSYLNCQIWYQIVCFLAFERAASNGDRLVSTLWLCSLNSAFQNMKWLLQEMHTTPILVSYISEARFLFQGKPSI